MRTDWRALRSGESVQEQRRRLERAHERFLGDTDLTLDHERRAHFASSQGLRSIVLDSWLRSHLSTIDPDHSPDHRAFDDDELAELRGNHPLARVMPVVQRLLFDEAADNGLIVAVGDAEGRLLWVEGDHLLRTRAEAMGFAAGMDWSEQKVGTSAPGSAIALDHAIQVLGPEHYVRAVHEWSCTAVPVHDPTSGSIIGVVDVTGGDAAASPHLLPLLEATLAAVEAELKLESLRALVERERATPQVRRITAHRLSPRLVVLGRDPAVLESGGAIVPVAQRHAEILIALSRASGGLSAAALAEEVYGDLQAERTLRAEIVRLRKWLGMNVSGLDVASRPYRLSSPLRIDAHEMLASLSRGSHRLALAAYDGPVLPGSASPTVETLRAESDANLREAMLQSAAPEALFEYAQNWTLDDAEVWQTLLRVLPPLSPKRARVVARLEVLLEADE